MIAVPRFGIFLFNFESISNNFFPYIWDNNFKAKPGLGLISIT